MLLAVRLRVVASGAPVMGSVLSAGVEKLTSARVAGRVVPGKAVEKEKVEGQEKAEKKDEVGRIQRRKRRRRRIW